VSKIGKIGQEMKVGEWGIGRFWGMVWIGAGGYVEKKGCGNMVF
jgi:hypothetical protein